MPELLNCIQAAPIKQREAFLAQLRTRGQVAQVDKLLRGERTEEARPQRTAERACCRAEMLRSKVKRLPAVV